MSLRNRYLRLVTALLPAGAFGLSATLAAAPVEAHPTDDASSVSGGAKDTMRVAEQLQTIRDAVSSALADGHVSEISDGPIQLAWWLNGNGLGWGNGGRVWGNGGHPSWGNGARVWNNGWGNGWGNGGAWGNGGGFWHNWRN